MHTINLTILSSKPGMKVCPGSVKTGFTLEVTLRKSRVENGWDLVLPYVVCPCLHAGPIFQGWLEVEVNTCHKM